VPGFLRLKEWAYAGIVFELGAATVSQAIYGHRQEIVAPVVLLGLALTSWALRPPSRVVGAELTKNEKCQCNPDVEAVRAQSGWLTGGFSNQLHPRGN
jgi:hypothetical protein